MAIKIQSTKEQHTDGIKLVLYGSSGVGKTVLGATAPEPLFLSAERGLLSLAGRDIPYIEIGKIEDLQEAYRALKEDKTYGTIVVDSLSEIAEMAVDNFKKEVKDPRQAYGLLADAISGLVRNFRNLNGKNVVFITKLRRVEDEESGSVTYEPYLPGRVIPFQLPYLVDEVFCMRIDAKGKRYLQTQPDRRYTAKDRSGLLLPSEEANLTSVFKKIIGK